MMGNASSMKVSKRVAPLALLAAALVLGTGCSRERGNVVGRVTFQGKPVTNARVVFCDPEYGTYITAALDADGRFEMRTAEGPGLWVGPYKVTIVPELEEPPIGPAPPPKPRPAPPVPPKYMDPRTTPLVVDVEETNDPFEFDLQP